MAYIRCRYCYEQGHNIKGCPKMKEAAKAGSSKNWEDRSYYERVAMEKVADYTEANKNRACAYCRSKGHTRRTCSMFASHLATRNELETRYRKGLVKYLTDPSCPIKIGSYVTWTTWDKKEVHAILTGVNEKHLSETDAFITRDLQYSSNKTERWVDYTILSAEGGSTYWGPQAGQISSHELPQAFNGSPLKIPFYYYYEDEYYHGLQINVISEGISPLTFPDKWVNGADHSAAMKNHKGVSDSSVKEEFERIRSFLNKIGF